MRTSKTLELPRPLSWPWTRAVRDFALCNRDVHCAHIIFCVPPPPLPPFGNPGSAPDHVLPLEENQSVIRNKFSQLFDTINNNNTAKIHTPRLHYQIKKRLTNNGNGIMCSNYVF